MCVTGHSGDRVVRSRPLDDGKRHTGYYVYDAASGARLKALPMPAAVSSGASIVDGTVYVGYGVFGPIGGVQALALP